jgi:hypothetical protein
VSNDIPDTELFHELDNIVEVSLKVPASPTVYDLALSYRKTIQRRFETGEEAVFDAELAVANAQRIALAARARVAALKAQLETLDLQIDTLKTFT